jgi:hypothetical protein
MKLGLILACLMLSNISLAQSLRDKRIKQEMLDRVDTLVTKINEVMSSLEREDPVMGCNTLSDIFKLVPDHLMGIGTRMNLFDPAVIKMEHESKLDLIEVHKLINICNNGVYGENVDLKGTVKFLKSMKKRLAKQKKKISKKDTDYENTYNYYYEFGPNPGLR